MDGDRARIQFIRILDRIAEARKVTWKILGDYAKQVALGGNPGSVSRLEFLLTSNKPYDLVIDLYVMGFVKKLEKELDYWWTEVEIYGCSFECIFYEHKNNYVFASDQISLSASGISLIQMDALDVINMNKGIGLIDRLSGLRSKVETLIMPIYNVPENIHVRGNNASIIRRLNTAVKNGYKIKGDSTLVIEKLSLMTPCPVCFENDRFTTKLQCNHTFCLECLASHMERVGDCHGKCPLCRRTLMLTLCDAN